MRRHLLILIVSAVAIFLTATAHASWAFRPSPYSHDPTTGQRVVQYAPPKTPHAISEANTRESGYRHIRSNVRGTDGSADRLHIVQAWGEGESIRPYGEWQRPFREGATPYGPWGNHQGPWTTPFDSWSNPYGLGRLPHPPWPHYPNQGPIDSAPHDANAFTP